MKYGGKYSLKAQLLREFDEMDVNFGYGTDFEGNLTPEFIAGEKKRKKEAGYEEEEVEEYLDDLKAQQDAKQNMSPSEFKKFQTSHMSEYVAKWNEYGDDLAKINSTKKVKTYRDLKLVLTACTMTDEEIQKRDSLMRKAGWVGVFTIAGLKIVKNLLTTVTGLDQVTKWAGVTKDIGETAIALVGHAMSDIPPKKAKSNPLSDALTLHHDYSVIIDPELEEDMFRELLSILDDMEEDGKLDDPIPASESSFTEYAEQYLEDNVGSPETGIHGADKAGDTAKLTDINIPKLSKKQEELFYAYVNIPMEILRNAHEIA